MKRSLVLPIYKVALVGSVIFVSPANASAGIDGCAKSVYFEANRDHNFNFTMEQQNALALAHDWQIYLQAHRYFHKSPPKIRMNLSEEPNIEFKSLTEQLGILGISEKQISTESTQLYTLQIAAFAKPQSVHRFVMEHWIKSGAEKRLIYNSTRKRLELSVQGGDVVVKGDPLYQQHARVGNRKFHRVRYGAYENIVDAKRDRLRIERTTGLHAQIVPCVLSASLINQTWLQPVANRFIGSPFA